MQQRPPSLLGAAAVQAADAVIVLAASVLAGVRHDHGPVLPAGAAASR